MTHSAADSPLPAHRLPAHKGRSLILLGHGSHLNADSSEAVRGHAAAVRATHLFDEVLEASWKEEPSLREALGLAQFCDVTAVPLFVSEGYFTGTVIPRELGLEWRGRRRYAPSGQQQTQPLLCWATAQAATRRASRP